MNTILKNEKLTLAIEASIEAGMEILTVYDTDFDVEKKEDNSPLTQADQKAHNAIVKYLQSTGLPVLSEEGKHLAYEERKKWNQYWLVDPLDGTKEFVKRNGEFTVNIALMEGNYPIAGVIYVPVKRVLYVEKLENGAFKTVLDDGDTHSNISELLAKSSELPLPVNGKPYTMVGSKSHPSAETAAYFDEIKKEKGEIEVISMGSSLKLCLVAEGRADEYPRFAPTMEWDTAAGQAIVEASGGEVLNRETGERMAYNKENLLNSWFLARR